jgi:hypothetical protein
VLAGTSLTEEGVEGIIPSSNGLVTGHLAIRLDAMLEAIKLPAGITDLDTGLANVDRDALPHSCGWCRNERMVGVMGGSEQGVFVTSAARTLTRIQEGKDFCGKGAVRILLSRCQFDLRA